MLQLSLVVPNKSPYLSKHEKVVTMEMHGMSDEEVVVHDYPNRSVTPEIIHIPLLGYIHQLTCQ